MDKPKPKSTTLTKVNLHHSRLDYLQKTLDTGHEKRIQLSCCVHIDMGDHCIGRRHGRVGFDAADGLE